jgi:hypothetical protein
MMRNDDIDELDLSQHRPSRWPGLMVIGAAVGVALIAAWTITPFLMAKDTPPPAGLLPAPAALPTAVNEPPTAPTLSTAEASPVAPDDPASPSAAPAAAETTPSTPWGSAPAAWPHSRAVQVAMAPAAAAPPRLVPAPPPPPRADEALRLAAVAPQDTPAEPFATVPLPRKRPSRQIAASLVIPLPRPRPDIEPDAQAGATTFDLQVERMR